MLRIVVFDGGWGGQVVANFLASELATVEVIPIIDWQCAPYEDKTFSLLLARAKKLLSPQIGKADLIVLGGYAVSLLLRDLERTYPKQKFVGMGINFYRVLKTRLLPKCVTVMCEESLRKSSVLELLRENLPDSTLVFPDCSGWEYLIDIGEMSTSILRYELEDYFVLYEPPKLSHPDSASTTTKIESQTNVGSLREHIANFIKQDNSAFRPDIVLTPRPVPLDPNRFLYHPDVILLLNTHYWEIKCEIQEVFGFSVAVMDFRNKLLHDVCVALGLLGTDGCRSK